MPELVCGIYVRSYWLFKYYFRKKTSNFIRFILLKLFNRERLQKSMRAIKKISIRKYFFKKQV